MPRTLSSFIRRPPTPADVTPSPTIGAPPGSSAETASAPSGVEWLPRHRPDRRI